MRYVIDASVALKWVLSEIDSSKALTLRAEYQAGNHKLLSPDIFSLEVSNSLARAERNGTIAAGDAEVHLVGILSTCPQLFPYHPLLIRALAIATVERHGVYDCLYVALAEREACELITAGDRLVKKLSPKFPFIVTLASLP